MTVKKFLHKPTGNTVISSNGSVMFDSGQVHHAPDWMLKGSDWEEITGKDTKYVKIVRCIKSTLWYALTYMKAPVYEVEECHEPDYYRVVNNSFYILKTDCELCDKDGNFLNPVNAKPKDSLLTKKNYKQFIGVLSFNTALIKFVVNTKDELFKRTDLTNHGEIEGFFIKENNVFVTFKDSPDSVNLDLVKKQNQEVKKDWEINDFDTPDPYVTRLKDGLKIQVGDQIMIDSKRRTVTKITIPQDKECYLHYDTPEMIIKERTINLMHPGFRKLKPVFQTSNGEDVYEGDEYFMYNIKTPSFIWNNNCLPLTNINPKLYKTFLSRKDAEDDAIKSASLSISIDEIVASLGYPSLPEKVKDGLHKLYQTKLFKK